MSISKIQLLMSLSIVLWLSYHEVISSGCPLQEIKNLDSVDTEKDASKMEQTDFRDLLKKGGQVSPRSVKMFNRNRIYDSKLRKLMSRGYSKEFAKEKIDKILEELDIEVEVCKKTLPDCDLSSKYRTLNGQCNNIENPFYGSQGYQLTRFLPAKYEDEESNPTENSQFEAEEGCVASGPLPNARFVSESFHSDMYRPSEVATNMIAQWGMFVAHDLSFVPSAHGSKCCEGSTDDSCFPIQIFKNDSFYSNFNVTCLNFYRSVRYCSSSPREQFNDITSFIDASNVYGSNDDQLEALRVNESYLMKTSLTPSGKELLPKDCKDTYVAGDARAILVSGLASVHTLFVREHNRIARFLANKYPTNSNETVFQETRRIIGAIMQNIIYGEFLQIVLGEKTMKEYGLNLKYPSAYDIDVNPTVASSFVAAAYRFGHSMIQNYVSRSAINRNGVNYTFPLLNDFFDMRNYEDNNGNGMEEIIYGLANFPAQSADRYVVKEVTNYLFNNGKSFGTDLEAKTILRGRDHGLPPYGDWRKLCGLKPMCNWEDRPHEIPEESWAILKNLYSSPNDIDLHTAGLAETPIHKTILGPINNCIIAHQFKALKDGDRFFFTHENEVGSFTRKQVDSIFNVSLARVICDNTDIEFINENVFRSDSKIISCSDFPQLDLDLF